MESPPLLFATLPAAHVLRAYLTRIAAFTRRTMARSESGGSSPVTTSIRSPRVSASAGAAGGIEAAVAAAREQLADVGGRSLDRLDHFTRGKPLRHHHHRRSALTARLHLHLLHRHTLDPGGSLARHVLGLVPGHRAPEPLKRRVGVGREGGRSGGFERKAGSSHRGPARALPELARCWSRRRPDEPTRR